MEDLVQEVIAAGGSRLLIPAVLFVLVLYSIRGLSGLHKRRSQNRKEFLDLWDSTRSQDDLWLEVVIRHLFGTYLPARIIRLAFAQPNKAQSLLDLAELWPLFQFDPTLQTASWLHKRHATSKKRSVGRAFLLVSYVVSALVAALSALIAFQNGPGSFLGWLYGLCALIFGLASVLCLMREDTIKTAATVGENWLERINRAAPQQTAASNK